MKIAIFLPDLRGGGAERVSIDLADAFREQHHEVEFVLLSAGGELLDEARSRHSVVDLSAGRARSALKPLGSYLTNSRPTALIASMWPLTAIAPIAARMVRSHCGIVTVEHNALSTQYASWGRLHHLALRLSLFVGTRLTDVAAGVSRGVAEDLARLALQRSSKVSVLYNPIPFRAASSETALCAARQTWPVAEGKRVLTVGSLKQQKNHRLLLEAFSRLHCKDVSLVILGQGALEPELRTMAQGLGIAERVEFAGFHRDPSPFYGSADLFVLSSDHEGLPTVLIEALAAGLPVVSTDCPSGPSEILQGGALGRLVPVGDAAALAAAMDAALAAPGDPAPRRARAADFAPDKIAARYLETLSSARHRAAGGQ